MIFFAYDFILAISFRQLAMLEIVLNGIQIIQCWVLTSLTAPILQLTAQV
jgi:hypothetical protein